MMLCDIRTAFIFICASMLVSSSDYWVGSYVYQGWRQTSGKNTHARHMPDCVAKCMRELSGCKSISYNAENFRCSINANERAIIVKDNSSDTVVLQTSPGIEAMLVMEGDRQSDYAYDYNQAVDICLGFRGRLMNETELVELFNNGENTCKCGWLLEGTQKYSTQGGNISSCNILPGVYPCNEPLAHAWCSVDSMVT